MFVKFQKNRNVLGLYTERGLNWTKSAISCYECGCMCNKCTVHIEGKCNMKAAVLELVKRYGKPPIKRGEYERSEIY